MAITRRDFLRGAGALIISFSALPGMGVAAPGQEISGERSTEIDPKQLDSWLAVGTDGRVTACTGKCDLGQGMFTAQTQLVAEELCVPLTHVLLIECDTARTPDQGSTSGSQSTPTNFNDEHLALAAATAREALLNLAAARFGEPVETLTVQNAIISGRGGKQVGYGELVGGHHFNLPLNRTAQRRKPSEWTVLGKPVPSLDRPALMTGQFEYVQGVRVPGTLHGRVVRPPEMGATLLAVDESSIADIDGVVKVVTRKDFVGVVARTQHAAVRAARELKVTWKPGPALPPQDGFFNHLKQQPSHDALTVDSGDLPAEVASEGRRLQARYTYPFQMHGSVGTSCAVADVRPNEATVWSATQSVYPTRSILAKFLGMPAEVIRVIYTRGSGCYGLNGADAVSFDAAMLSQAVGHPVRLQYSRQDEMMWENLGSAVLVEHRASLAADGGIAAWDREDWVASLGNRPGYDHPGNVISGMLVGFPPEALEPSNAKQPGSKLRNGSNTVPNYLAGCVGGTCGGDGTIRSERVLTHTVPSPFFTGPLRAPLRIQNTFANECFMDELALAAGQDPVAFRLRHLSNPRLIAVLKAAAGASGWNGSASPPAPAQDSEVSVGRGVACVAYEGDNGYAALVAEVAVHRKTGEARPRRLVLAIDCGPVSNPDGLRNQIEGGLLQGSSRALVEEVRWDGRRITSFDWETYRSLRLDLDLPLIESVIVSPPGVRATGAGETAITVTPAALGNAIFAAIGVRLREVPFTPERVLAGLKAQKPGSARRSA